MDRAEMDKYKKKLLLLKNNILNGGLLKSSEDLHISSDDLPDETDLANNVIQQNVSFSIRSRELRKLRMIEVALQKIEEGTYGLCDDCDEEIEVARLNNQPWANLCIIHAEERERENSKYVKNG
ncbi:MAG: TraR/DksA family transcriptional regulator [Oligoflexia bacterium]|nr:TraR/DksA family transcriptional regulator [Oligoflexia bacterium]MBF0364270.1 TraR/DksA family transcriptional regulator [Oligoflexia bacterium]